MKKLIVTAFFSCVFIVTVFSQVGIGTNTPNSSSVLELSSTNKAFIPPRMTTAQRGQIVNPVAGMMIFNTTTNCIELYRSAGWFNLCAGNGGGGSNGPTSDSVATANLIAHWTFDNTKAESISGLSPATNGTTSSNATGRIGGALNFSGANLVYPTIPAINSATALQAGFTLTMWVKLPVQPLYSSIFQINGNIGDIFGLVGLAHRKGADGTLDFDGTLTHVNGTGTHSAGFSTALEGPASGFIFVDTAWAFLAMTYDSTARTISYYGNGALKGSKSVASVIPSGQLFELVTTASNPPFSISQVSFGSLDVTPTFPGGAAPASWQSPNLIAGTTIDDTRLFNKTLSQVEITNLYNYGLGGK